MGNPKRRFRTTFQTRIRGNSWVVAQGGYEADDGSLAPNRSRTLYLRCRIRFDPVSPFRDTWGTRVSRNLIVYRRKHCRLACGNCIDSFDLV